MTIAKCIDYEKECAEIGTHNKETFVCKECRANREVMEKLKDLKMTMNEYTEYWQLSNADKAMKSKEYAERTKKSITEHFYFWRWSPSYGWRQLGRSDGYDTKEEAERDNEFTISDDDPWCLTNAKIVEEENGAR